MPMFFGDATFLLLIPAMILSMWAQFRVSSSFNKYSQVMSRRGKSGAEVARSILQGNGIYDVGVELGQGHLSDHYDPKARTIRLSDAVYNSSSIAAISVAAHEAGHALQHDTGYAPLFLRSFVYPVAGFGSKLAMPLFIIGFLLGEGGFFLVELGILLFACAVLFQVITLPVEFNASRRAIAVLRDGGYLAEDEVRPARKVLSAAAMTYVAATLAALLQLLRLILISGRRR
ncbi:MAG: zinc metallopeptidase [Defluviitaleaceae bacterium]|nr:zinc metallopeptidase [Defluviitaleaceae bacterium]